MAYFGYQGRTIDGKAKRGKISAETKQEAIARIKEQGINVFSIKKLNSLLYKEIEIGKKIKNRDFIIFLRQLSTLIHAGIPIIEATIIMEDQLENKHFKQALRNVTESIEAGQSLSDAMKVHLKIFPALLINMVHAGEISGNLDDILDSMATYYEKQYQLRQKVISALTYPAVVGAISLLVTFFLLTFIVPIFADMFQSYGEELPAYTAFILYVSEIAKSYWWIILVLIITCVVIYKQLRKKNDRYAYLFDLIKLRIPIFGVFLQKSLMARLTQTLSSLLASSVPILQAVKVTEQVMENRVIQSILQESQDSLEEGETLAKPMEAHWLFPKLVTQMIAIGERSGSLDEMLQKVADFYEQELDAASDKMKVLLEPLMIVFLTIIVGAIVLAIIIPMFSIFETI